MRLLCVFNTLRPRQNGRRFADDNFKCIFENENVSISIEISLKFVLKGPINNIPVLVQIMAWRRPGDKPLSEPMMVCLQTHICVTRPQWVNYQSCINFSSILLHLVRGIFHSWLHHGSPLLRSSNAELRHFLRWLCENMLNTCWSHRWSRPGCWLCVYM